MKLSVMGNQSVHLLEIYVFHDSPFQTVIFLILKWSLLKFTPQVYSSSFKFTPQVYPPFETVIDDRSRIYVFSESPFKTVTITFKLSFRVNLSAQVYHPHLKLSLMVDHISMCSVRAHLKQSPSPSSLSQTRVTFKFTPRPESPSSILPKSPSSLPPPPFETVIDGR